MVGESTVTHLPARKITKQGSFPEDKCMGCLLYIFYQICRTGCGMDMRDNMDMIDSSANYVRVAGFLFKNTSNIGEEDFFIL